MKYQKIFNSHSEYESYISKRYLKPNVSVCKSGNSITEVHYTPVPPPQYLTFTAEQSNSTIRLNRVGSAETLPNATIWYSTDSGETWNDYTYTQQGTRGFSGEVITLSHVGDKVMLKGRNETLATDSFYQYHNFVMTGKIAASGEIDTLLNETGINAVLGTGCYMKLFSNCKSMTTAPELPNSKMAPSCYYIMFESCSTITVAPELPSTELANACYGNMFRGCTGLTTPPELPATTLADNCYTNMFNGCWSLATAPELPATTLVQSCYSNMFNNCTGLRTAPELPATTISGWCCSGMFQGCTGLTTAPSILPATYLYSYCYNQMFKGCRSLTTAPILPATNLSPYLGCSRAYGEMFSGCTNLNYIKAMFLTTPNTSYTKDWVAGVSSTGTFVKNSEANWNQTGSYAIPTGWTVETASS